MVWYISGEKKKNRWEIKLLLLKTRAIIDIKEKKKNYNKKPRLHMAVPKSQYIMAGCRATYDRRKPTTKKFSMIRTYRYY